MAIQTPGFRMADNLAGGRLLEIVRDGLTAGRSPEQISRTLYADFKIEVSGSTLRRWLDIADAAEKEGAA